MNFIYTNSLDPGVYSRIKLNYLYLGYKIEVKRAINKVFNMKKAKPQSQLDVLFT
jgi:hypothetical protein